MQTITFTFDATKPLSQISADLRAAADNLWPVGEAAPPAMEEPKAKKGKKKAKPEADMEVMNLDDDEVLEMGDASDEASEEIDNLGDTEEEGIDEPTVADVQKAAAAHCKRHGGKPEKTVAVLKKLGVSKVKELKSSQYAKALKLLAA